jgi:adenine-specific DNA-methyltransferase
MNTLSHLQNLLRELFQLDLADLDFGLYRLFHLKRHEIEAFLAEQLPRRVKEAFQTAAGEDSAALERELSDLAKRVRTEIADDAILESGEINPEYRGIKAKAASALLHDYQAIREKLKGVQVSEAQQNEVFNHLYAFFSRYYEAGDFIPRRRYGVREAYAVPYQGEEVFFHWANKDQHYVKTGEAFRDYAFSVGDALGGPYRVRFVLAEASLPPGNIKGDTRYFFPVPGQSAWDEESKELRLPFHYRLPTEQEILTHGKNSKLQESILQSALPKILEAVPNAMLGAALSSPVEQKEEQEISLLLKRLRHFCRRNTTDYFIHKNLKGFLTQELEFYLKDQVLHLADLEAGVEGKLRTLRVLRRLAEEIITFLAQIEDVEKRLFEKRKFVLQTDYLVPIKEVPKELWGDVIKNQAQIKEWQDLFAIDPERNLFNQKGKVNRHFLSEHPTLVVNTAHFDPEFKDRLLAAFDDLDEAMDGLLIHSENYQALRLLEHKYAGKIKCIYIDPPYNTGSDEFIYKDRYRHSSWLAMMIERLSVARNVFSEDGCIFVSIDDNEVIGLKDLMNSIFGTQNFVASIIWQKVFSPKSTARHFSEAHDFILCFAKNGTRWTPNLLPRTAAADARYQNPDNDPRRSWTSGDLTARNYYSEGQYEVTSPSGKKFRPAIGTYWRINYAKFLELDGDKRIWWGPDGDSMPRLKRFLSEVKQGIVPQTLWPYSEVGHTQEAKQELLSIVKFLRTEDVLNTVKPTRLIKRILDIATDRTNESLVLDFFAGSAPTGDAVIRQNREDGGRRKFILVEMAHYFDDIILQRIQRAIYAPEWKDCQPKRLPTKEEVERTPRLVKILRLEGYEDALHNLTTDETLQREEPRAEAYKKTVGGDAYRVFYLVRLPLESSATLLNLSALEHPFDYKLEVLTDKGPKIETVDLVETFNFLYGLHVERLETWLNEKDSRVYRVVKGRDRDKRRVLVLWRDMGNFDPAMERHFLEKKISAEGPFDEILINGDTATPGIRSLDAIFKRLIAEEER